MRSLIFGVIFAVFFSAAGAFAQSHERARDALQAGQIRPLGEIISRVMGQTGGEVLDAELHQGQRGWIYRVKILTPDGRVEVVPADAQTGRILRRRR